MKSTSLTSLLLAGLALPGVLPACGAPTPSSSSRASIGVAAPDVRLAWLDGSPGGTLHDLRGRVVLLEFWRTW